MIDKTFDANPLSNCAPQMLLPCVDCHGCFALKQMNWWFLPGAGAPLRPEEQCTLCVLKSEGVTTNVMMPVAQFLTELQAGVECCF
jgi:hypothetical protein